MNLPFLRTQLFAIILGVNVSHAITMRVGSPDDSRFVGNNPGAAQNGTFQYDDYDFSGVGWDNADTRKSITLISDTHFLAARHFTPSANVSFRDTMGIVHSYSVASYVNISNIDYPLLSGNSDLRVGTLTTAVSPNINYYSLLDPSLSPVGQDILVYGQNGRIGESSIIDIGAVTDLDSGVQGIVTLAQYVIASGGPDDAYLSSGDSGSPSFIVRDDGELILSGIHWAVGEDATNRYIFDTYPSAYINRLNMVSGLTVTTSLIPEPSTGMLLGLAVLTLSLRRRR